MKYLFFLILPLFFILPQERRIEGKYKMEYEKHLNKYNCTIVFKEDNYEKQLPSGKKIKGRIEYKNFLVNLIDDETALSMSIPKREIGNDTVYFKTFDSLESKKQEKELMVFSGKLIKIK